MFIVDMLSKQETIGSITNNYIAKKEVHSNPRSQAVACMLLKKVVFWNYVTQEALGTLDANFLLDLCW